MIPDGIILLDKKEGITSMASDNFIKKIAGTRKVGHSGTLDPFATGLLPVFTGKALKVMRYTDDYDKAYECTAVFGVRTSTMDPEGEITAVSTLTGSDEEFEAIRDAFSKLSGITSQVPPSFSAKKIDGQKAYDLARRGVEVTMPSHPVKIYSLEVRGMSFEDGRIYADISVECSKGTYIRSICDDAGEMTGFHAHALRLRRTKAGPFDIKDSYTEEQIALMSKAGDYSFVIPRDRALAHLTRIELTDKDYGDVKLGRKISASRFVDVAYGVKVAAFHRDELTAVLYKDNGVMRIERMLAVEQ
ncbi:MAG: tRNA pseudouridine(55) synthase TruB [Clostridiales bacterium]|nr:tRNA pseudouridine(55) synthase TruB [Clostridiales bacterium]